MSQWTSDRIVAALRNRYGREAALIEQVANATGQRARRWLDVIAVGLWPSRGLYLHGIEVKVTRNDLVRELALPEKAEDVAKYCDRFFIAIPATLRWDDLAIPEGWGVYTVSDDSRADLVTLARPGVAIQALEPDRTFIAAVARRLVEQHGDVERTRRIREEAAAEAAAMHESMHADELHRLMESERAARLEANTLRRALGTSNPEVVRRVISIVRDLHGNVGALNALRVNAQIVLNEADELERLARALIPTVEVQEYPDLEK